MTSIYERRIPPVDPRQEVGVRALEAKVVNPPVVIDFSEINPEGLSQLLKSHIEMMGKALGAGKAFSYNPDWGYQALDDRAEIHFNFNESRIIISPDSENFKPMQWVFYEYQRGYGKGQRGITFWADGAFTNLVIGAQGHGLTFIKTDDAGRKICSHISPTGVLGITTRTK